MLKRKIFCLNIKGKQDYVKSRKRKSAKKSAVDAKFRHAHPVSTPTPIFPYIYRGRILGKYVAYVHQYPLLCPCAAEEEQCTGKEVIQVEVENLPELLTLEEVGTILRLSRKTLLHHIRKGRIKAVGLSRQHKLVPKHEVSRILDGSKNRTNV